MTTVAPASPGRLLRPTGDDAAARACMAQVRHDYGHHIEYHEFFANHAAHGVIALHQLGATPDRIEDFAHHYETKLRARKELTPDPRITRENLTQHIGTGIEWEAYLAFFEGEWRRVAEEHAEHGESTEERLHAIERQLLNDYFPRLVPFVAGHATHPLIHLGFGLVLSQTSPPMWMVPVPADGQKQPPMNPITIAGLAYLCFRGLRLGTVEYTPESFQTIAHANSRPLLAVIGEAIKAFLPFLPELTAKAEQSPYAEMPIGVFQRRMMVIAEYATKPLLDIDIQWAIDPANVAAAVEEMRQVVLFLYALSANDFFTLHGVTSYFALCQVLPQLTSSDDQVTALRHTLKMIAAVFVVRSMPAHDSPILARAIASGDLSHAMSELMSIDPQYLESDWPSLTAKAIATNNEHTQKLVFVCRHDDLEDRGATARDFFRWCAAKRIHLSEHDDD